MRLRLVIGVLAAGLLGGEALAQSGAAVQPDDSRYPGRVWTAPLPIVKADPAVAPAAEEETADAGADAADTGTTPSETVIPPARRASPAADATDASDPGPAGAAESVAAGEEPTAAESNPTGGGAVAEDAPETAPEAGDGDRVAAVLSPNAGADPAATDAPAEGEAAPQLIDRTETAAGGERFHRAPERTYGFDPDAPAQVAPVPTPETTLQRGARLRQLDKMAGTTRTVEIAVGETRLISRLQVRLEACRSPGDNDTHGTMAFLKVWDTKHPDAPPAFSGWMFAESPALSALDHPRYDLWVISCTTPSGEESAASE